MTKTPQTAHKRRAKKTAAAPEIRFYRANEKPYGAFSNLFQRSIEFEGATYPTSEHAYQAGKARKLAVREWILSAPTPALAAMAAHGLYVWDVVPNWAQIKFDRMRAVLRAKFDQHADLRICCCRPVTLGSWRPGLSTTPLTGCGARWTARREHAGCGC